MHTHRPRQTRHFCLATACALLWACAPPVQNVAVSLDAAVGSDALTLADAPTPLDVSDVAELPDVTDAEDAPDAPESPDATELVPDVAMTDVAPPEDAMPDMPDTLDASNDADTLTPPAPPTLADWQAALTQDDAVLVAGWLPDYDMPVCDATQCLFLVVAPGAQAVSVQGEWTGWATDQALAFAPQSAVWWAVIPLQIATWVEYKVKVDGVWSLDPSNPHFRWNTFGPNSAIYAPGHSRLRRVVGVESPQLGNTRDLYVYLPAAYDLDKTEHFPVLYMQDGFNIFTNPKAPFGSWDVETTCDALMADGQVQPVIVVGIDTANRNEEYVYGPLHINGQPTVPKLPLYADFLTQTVKPLIDDLFRTLPDRAHTAMGGSSLGGISSLWIGWTQWQTFGLVASFSGAYWIGEEGAVWNGSKTGDGPPMRAIIADATASNPPPVGSLRIYLDSGDTGFDNVASYNGDAWVYSDWTRNALVTAGWDTRAQWQTTPGQPVPADLPVTTKLAQVPSLPWSAAPIGGWKNFVQPTHNLLSVVGHGHQHNEAAWKQRFGAMLRFLWPGPGLK